MTNIIKNRDNIDFGKENIKTLFRKILVPTIIGMTCMSAMTMIDGAFVGHGAGSDALAAVNIFSPMWLVMSGIGLMMGVGCSVVASIHLSKGNVRAANINVTQMTIAGSIVTLLLTFLVQIFDVETARLFGATDILLPYVLQYQKWMSLAFWPIFLQCAALLLIRLDGSPKYASLCSALPSIINVILDYVFLYVCGWGLEGVAMATAIGCAVGGLLAIIYILFLSKTIKLYRLKWSLKSLKLSLRNISYQVNLGFSTLLGELSMATLMMAGNFMFLKYIGEDGVAAFSIACYLYPFIFMTGNAISQSSQPIISYNYGDGNMERVGEARKIALYTALFMGFVLTFLAVFCAPVVVSLFLDSSCNVYHLATAGLPMIACGFVSFILNVTLIAYYQSIEVAWAATTFSALRGIILLVPSFILMPIIIGNDGLWFAMPVAEILTLMLLGGLHIVEQE